MVGAGGHFFQNKTKLKPVIAQNNVKDIFGSCYQPIAPIFCLSSITALEYDYWYI